VSFVYNSSQRRANILYLRYSGARLHVPVHHHCLERCVLVGAGAAKAWVQRRVSQLRAGNRLP
jgi:hypothetical protein